MMLNWNLQLNQPLRLEFLEQSAPAAFGAEKFRRLTGDVWYHSAGGNPEILITSGGKALPGGVPILCKEFYGLFYYEEKRRFELILRGTPSPETCCFLWELAMLAGVAAKIFRGENVFLMHGALLATKPGQGVLLCGPSGVGKSTTARRWQNEGGAVVADDMVLMEYAPEKWIAHPMPTWSRVIAHPAEFMQERVDCNQVWRVENLFGLGRGEAVQEIRVVSEESYFLKLYAACSLFELILVPKLPRPLQKVLAQALRERAEMLAGRFPCRTLFAHLEGNLHETLKGYVR